MFFERMIGILPIQVKHLGMEHIIRCIEVMVKKEIGSERLLRDYLLLKVEKRLYELTTN